MQDQKFKIAPSALLLAVLAGCGPPCLKDPTVIRGVARSTPRELVEQVSEQNRSALEYYRHAEWPLNVIPNQPPRLAISLSGGGIRSAVFSLGVLAGLHKLELFPQKTDLVSAVSGGGYTASWFYGQQILHGHKPDQLLDPEKDPQKDLRDSADFIQLRRHPLGLAAVLATLIPGIPINVILNGIPFGMRVNTTVPAYYYERRFRQVFLGPRTENSGRLSVSWPQIHELVRSSNEDGHQGLRLPNLILNTTVDLGIGKSAAEESGFNTIYEFSPQRFGSDGMGYHCVKGTADPLTGCHPNSPRKDLAPLERIAVTSGAALDSSFLDHVAPGAIERVMFSALNMDLGFWFKNPSRAKAGCALRFVPFLHLFNGGWYRKDSNGCRMLLTDGGHSENLGVYSLIRRLPSAIIVVDASQDEEQEFSGYHNLRSMLLRDLNITLSIPHIEESVFDEGFVFVGSAGLVPVAGNPGMLESTTIVYVKLPSLASVLSDCKRKRQVLPDTVCSYAKNHEKFPHEPTFSDQSFDPQQFEAYRDLGLCIICNNEKLITNALGEGFGTQKECHSSCVPSPRSDQGEPS